MPLTRRVFLAAATILPGVGVLATPSVAGGTTVLVSLWDKGADTPMGKGMGMGMHGDMAMVTMGIDAKPGSVKAGEVTFKVVNASKDTVHEMVLSPITTVDTLLPYNEALEKVDEDAAGHLGEVAELEPGQSGGLTLTLKPGTYILYCNIPGHYAAGMWTVFTVGS